MKKTVRCGLLLLLFFVNNPCQSQVVPAALDILLKQTLDSMRNVTGAQSLSAAIQFKDGAIWADAKGVSSLTPQQDVTTDDAYLIGSVTKTITSACILQLAQNGQLNLDDSLYEWLDPMPYIDSNITIRQLMQHTSGLFDVLAHPHNQDSLMADISRIWTPEELIQRFMAPPLFSPGSSWSYCNTNYFLLSMIIKKITGHDFYTEYRNRFFTPFGLSSFAIPSFETLNAPVAHLWLDITGDGVKDDANGFYMSYMSLNSTAGAAGGYFSTPTDCTKWMRKYMRGDVISPAMMLEAKTVVNAPGSQGNLYGLGIMKNSFLGFEAWGHGGDLAYHASSWYFPAKDASITVFTNDNDVTSWTLLNVVKELLRTYNKFQITNIQDESHPGPVGNISAYPNPIREKLVIAFELNMPAENVEILLKNTLGQTVVKKHYEHMTGKQKLELKDVFTLNPGMYFLNIIADGQSGQIIKLVK